MNTRGGAVRADERKSCRSCEYCGARASRRLTINDMDDYGFFVDPTHEKCVTDSLVDHPDQDMDRMVSWADAMRFAAQALPK